jgi:hypothetical protein
VAHLAGIGVAERHDDDAVVLQHDLRRDDRHLDAAVLVGCRRHHRRDLVDQRSTRPERPGLIEEILELCRHHPVTGRNAEDEAVVLLELEWVGDRRLLVELVVGGLGDLQRHQLCNALDGYLGAGRTGALCG